MIEPTRSTAGALIKVLGKGRRLAVDVGEALERLFGTPVGNEGLSRLFQPGFPGVRTFVVEARLAPDQAVEMTLVGIARDGAPVCTSSRAFVRGRGGALEIHHGFQEIDEAYRSRNITVDLIQRELDILELVDTGPSSRITIDAEGVGHYICAIHGFIFADESEEGPPVRSVRALDPGGDRQMVIEASRLIVERIAQRRSASERALKGALAELEKVQVPWDLARLTFADDQDRWAEGDDGELGVGKLGYELLLARELPLWRAALPIGLTRSDLKKLGDDYRRRKTHRSEVRLAQEIQEARELLSSNKREARIRGLKTLGMIAPSWVAPDIKAIEEGPDRRLAAIARQTLRQVTGADLADQLLAYASNARNEARLRGLAYRVVAEHYRSRLASQVHMLRVNPDPRIQRAVIPIIADDPTDAGPNLASMLAANPSDEEHARPGLLELRIELIERLSQLADPRTLPALMAAYRAQPPPPPEEMLALARALVAFPDPRAQLALTEVARRLERPAIP
jgi:hypothetical protein